MNQRLNISIKKPCSEDFNKFASTEKGGFCSSCNKEVIDFSTMNNAEIVKYFNSNNEKTCGNFRKDQLKYYLDYRQSNLSYKFNFLNRSVLGFSLVSLLSFNYSFSQEKKIDTILHKTQNNSLNNEKFDSSIKPEKFFVKGIVLDELGALPGASVVLKNSTIGVTTNSDGKFEFKEPIDKDAILIVSFVGFEKIEFKVSKNEEIILHMDQYTCFTTGEVSSNKVFKSKRTFFQKIIGFFKND
jgi:hypothetical protein